MNILFTCAGRRNYLINYFKLALNGRGKVFATDMDLTAPALVDADVALTVPSIYSEEYISTLRKIILDNEIQCLIPLNDLELPILSRNKDELENLGVKVIVSDEEVIKTAFDKWDTTNFLNKIGINTPKSYITLVDAIEAIKNGEIQFPIVIKPRWGSASIGIEFPEDIEELVLSYKLLTLRIRRSILGKASEEDFSRSIIIQEKIRGAEYGMDVLNDFSCDYFGTFVRQKLQMRSGETDKAISVIDPRFESIGRRISRALKHIGNLDCDVFEYQGQLYVLELNPRFGGGYPFSHEAGINTAAIYLEWLNGKYDIQKFNNYKAGIMFSKCDRLLRVN